MVSAASTPKDEERPRLIILNGPPGIGKTTIAQLYIREHPLALHIDVDRLIAMLGEWRDHEPRARNIAYGFALDMARRHLMAGHDVIVPFIVTRPERAAPFETMAWELDVPITEILLWAPKKEATEWLLERGVWGEEGRPPLTQDDVPEAHRLYDVMMATHLQRQVAVPIPTVHGDAQATYRQVIRALKP